MFDTLIVGAGPAGLSLAALLSGHGLSIGIIDSQSMKDLNNPSFDGREIALTQHSMALLEKIGVTSHFEPNEFSNLHAATVINGRLRNRLNFSAPKGANTGLGFMVSNHAIKRGLFRQVNTLSDVKIVPEDRLLQISKKPDQIVLTTSSGKLLQGRLLVAADSRFSATRKMVGIGASMTDFGKTMLVCRMTHDMPHHDTAYEIFGLGQTIALLPLKGNQSSVVITLPAFEIERLMALEPKLFTREIERRLNKHLGLMNLESERFSYPLVAVYASKFTTNRIALVGDAAVGMHPVTAHGFNLGLLGAETLANQLISTTDTELETALSNFERIHRRMALPLYLGTNAIAKLYTDDRFIARTLRAAGLMIGSSLPIVKRKVVSKLMSS
jgi:ubiquinone biosynthesis UbiH/UbiF/VisC/COQ6 family hydroxylase